MKRNLVPRSLTPTFFATAEGDGGRGFGAYVVIVLLFEPGLIVQRRAVS